MKKFRNYGFWTALSGALVLFLKTLGDACGFSIQQETISNLVMALAELLVVFGIVVMPKNGEENSQTNGDKTQDKNPPVEEEKSCSNEKESENNDTDLNNKN